MHSKQHQDVLHSDVARTFERRDASLRCGMLGIGIALLAIASGCDSSPPLYPVSGQVLIDGIPATTGSIRFMPDDGRPATSAIDDAGQFKMVSQVVGGQQDGVMSGRYRVAVTSNEIVDAETARWLAPAKYADFRTSGLEVNVDGPLAGLKIDLTWDGAENGAIESAEDDATASETGDNLEPAAVPDATAAAE